MIARDFDAGGVRLRYLEQGDGPTVVLLHCFAGDCQTQFVATGFMAALSHGHRVLGLDLRGHGGSDKPHDPAAYGAQMTHDVVRLLDHVGVERAHVVGYSMGGHLVAHLLTVAPQRLASAVLGGACGRRHWTAADDARVALEADELERGSMRAQILRLWPGDKARPGDEALAARAQRYLTGKDPLALAAVRRANRAQVVTDAQMAAVRVPTLGLVGARDPYLSDFRALAGIMPVLQLEVIEGATHADAAARPEFLAAVRTFVAAHR